MRKIFLFYSAKNNSSLQRNCWAVLCFLMMLFNSQWVSSQSLSEQGQFKINELNALIVKAEKKGIDVLKEKMTVRTAEVFLKYADWDANHIDENADLFKLVKIYKDTARQSAVMLPVFERSEVIKMLDESTNYLQKLIDGKVFRKPTPDIDWTKVTNDGSQLTYRGKPVFLADYTWKPNVPELNDYFGNLGGVYIDQNKVDNNDGSINSSLIKELKSKPSGSIGLIFLGNKRVPNWSETKYGPGFKMREDTYTGYDIDNPGALELNGMLFSGTVPLMAGKRYTQLGYLLCNEPHFYTTRTGSKLDWASGPVSKYTLAKFRNWLKTRHSSITDLNTLWGTHFANFDDVSIDIPIDNSLQGTPKWYDWVTFNCYRVTQWYSAMKDSIRQYDPAGKVHLKIMPNLWTDNKRGHGIDMEALTLMSDIIGNDSGTDNALMWGGPQKWQSHYAYDWRELYMGYDFLKSVSPEKIIFNSEDHYLSTGRSRDLFQHPIYARSTFWAATTLGLNASQIWFWARSADGSVSPKAGKGYAGSNNQQPRIVNEVASTFMDLNAFPAEITAMQHQKKPIRIFYSETSATNVPSYMDDLFELYESLNFDGVPIGFATENIIKKQDNKLWDAILIRKTDFVTRSELSALQSYLDNGGTILSDSQSLKMDEYGRPLPSLVKSNGQLIQLNALSEMKTKSLEGVMKHGDMPEVTIGETNGVGQKTCSWKCVKNSQGNNVVSIVNLGKTDSKLKITLKNASTETYCKELIQGIYVSNEPTLKPNEVLFVEVTNPKDK